MLPLVIGESFVFYSFILPYHHFQLLSLHGGEDCGIYYLASSHYVVYLFFLFYKEKSQVG